MKLITFPLVDAESKKPAVVAWNKLENSVAHSGAYGLRTGGECGLLVVDVDVKNGKDGTQWEHYAKLPDTHTVQTPNGGMHYYYLVPQGTAVKSRNLPVGIDLKGDGGFVVGEGTDGYVPGKGNFTQAPEWLIEFCNQKPANEPYLATSVECEDVEPLAKQLATIPPDLHYEGWRDVLWASLNVYGCTDDVVEVLRDWSSTGSKWDETAFDKVINGYNPSALTEATLHYYSAPTIWPASRVGGVPSAVGKEAEANEITEEAFRIARHLLEDEYGNVLSTDHAADIRLLCEAMVNGAVGSDKFRLACPLFTGGGKTTTVKAVIAALKDTDYSVAVATESIAELGKLRDGLVALGVSPDQVGVYHADKMNKVESIPYSDVEETQFLLITHARVKGQNPHYKEWKGKPRSLLIWDEVFQSAIGEHLPITYFLSDVGGLSRAVSVLTKGGDYYPHAEEMVEWMNECSRVVEELFEEEAGGVGELPALPIALEDTKAFFSVVRRYITKHTEWMETLAEWSAKMDSRVRVAKPSNRFHTAIQFYVAIPDELKKIINLDAGAKVSKLLSLDESVSILPTKANKSYENVIVKHTNALSSKSAMHNLKEEYAQEIRTIVENEIPEGERVLVLGFKDDKLKNYFMREFGRYGWVKDKDGQSVPRVYYLHYGAHKASNDYTGFKYVITAGVLFRDPHELAAQVVAQQRNVEASINDEIVNEVQNSEQAQLLYQAFSRCHLRNTVDGKAGEATIYLFHPTSKDRMQAVHSLLDLMDGVKLEKRKAVHLREAFSKGVEKMAEELSDDILSYLAGVGMDKVSTSSIHKALSPGVPTNSRAWKDAVKLVGEQSVDWSHEGRSFVRR